VRQERPRESARASPQKPLPLREWRAHYDAVRDDVNNVSVSRALVRVLT
jgi:hypothetical protein